MCVLVAGRAPDPDPRAVERSTHDGHRPGRGMAKVVLQPLARSTLNLGPGGWSADGGLIALDGVGRHRSEPTRDLRREARRADLRQVSRSLDGRAQDWATFSPDGSRLLFVATRSGPTGGGIAGDLMVVNLTARASGSSTRQERRSWSPSGPAGRWTGRPTGRRSPSPRSRATWMGRSAVFVVEADGGEPDGSRTGGRGPSASTGPRRATWILSGDTTAGSSRYGWSTPATVNAGCSGSVGSRAGVLRHMVARRHADPVRARPIRPTARSLDDASRRYCRRTGDPRARRLRLVQLGPRRE